MNGTTSIDMRVQVDVVRASDGSIMAAKANAVGHAKIVDNQDMATLVTPANEINLVIPAHELETALHPDMILAIHAELAAGKLTRKLLKIVAEEMTARKG